ncbi:MAG: hypothetical protein JW810_08415 [Sedimentisphaerales bacterium]|nr:hypothetical protein [Sedimentisphaerales bacterium]
MKRRWVVSLLAGLSFPAGIVSIAAGAERLDRGMVALARPDGSVFLSWRLLQSDPPDIRFVLVRSASGKAATLTNPPISQTNFLDRILESQDVREVHYTLQRPDKAAADNAPLAQCRVDLTKTPKPYLSIPLAGDYDVKQVGVGDLDGDGAYEIVIQQPNFNTDPYQQPGYWKKSTTTYKIEAYELDGTLLWRYDMGWSIEAGTWYAPWVVYDIDGDGRAEVYAKAGQGDPRDEKGLVQSGPEYLVKLDGQTGQVRGRTDWIGREGYQDYNRYCRNFLAVACLDGAHPALIMQRGTYNLIQSRALDRDFQPLWHWKSTDEKKRYNGQGSHGLISADVDADGRDELVIGAAVIDDDGRGLWTLERGHPDVCYVADIDPDNDGLEIFYGFETRQNSGGLSVVDARTGRTLWTHPEPTKHVHGQGMGADVLAGHPGMEVFAGERDLAQRWLYSARGRLIEFRDKGTITPRALWWDADEQKEVIADRAIGDWGGPTIQPLEGRLLAVMDCLGDYREEAVTGLKGELRIYSTTIGTADRRVCLMQDRQYRLGVAAQTMGYYYPAQLGLAPADGGASAK